MATAKKTTQASAGDKTQDKQTPPVIKEKVEDKTPPPPADDTPPVEEIEEKDFTVLKTSSDPSLIHIEDDHSFTPEAGDYSINISTTLQSDVSIRVFNSTNEEIVISANNKMLVSTQHFNDDNAYRIEFRPGGEYEWQPIQTLAPSQYTVTLTLQN